LLTNENIDQQPKILCRLLKLQIVNCVTDGVLKRQLHQPVKHVSLSYDSHILLTVHQ